MGQIHPLGGLAPAGDLVAVHAECAGRLGIALRRLGRRAQVLLRHEVGVDVVVGEGAVLIRSGDAVDAEAPSRVHEAEGHEQSRRLDEQLEADLLLKRRVASRLDVLGHGVRDVGVDVERRGARRPIARAFCAVDGAPREMRHRAARDGALAPWPDRG